jgi:hypothetical protein
MTEAEWFSHQSAAELLEFACGRASERKYRLALCGLARSVWHLLYDDASRESVEVAERYVEGVASQDDLFSAEWAAEVPIFGNDYDGNWRRFEPGTTPERILRLVTLGVLSDAGPNPLNEVVDETARTHVSDAASIAMYCSAYYTAGNTGNVVRHLRRSPELWSADHIRCVFGNPFCPVTFDSAWRTEAVVGLARGMYESRDFSPMPVLADALEDAGCADPDVLTHCRGPGSHVRGCWVVDLILGKA